jgi:excinuclease ABC subunit C
VIKQRVDVGEVIDRDIVAIAREGNLALAVVLQLREGALIGRQHFQLAAEESDSDVAVLNGFLTQYYSHQPNLPEEVHLPMTIRGARLLSNWLGRLRGKSVKVTAPQKGDKSKLVKLANTNARLLLDELLIQKQTQTERTSKMVVSLKDDLHLSHSPRRVVCFDISNTGETDAVGSCVMFDNGKPKKSGYRHFKIKGESSQDDFRMMREVIGRYFHRINEENGDPPDLVVVDGGKGQLSAALAELKSLGFDQQAVIGLAKRLEEVFIPGQSDPLSISKTSPGLMLLKQLRDEAHRFAVTYNRKVRAKRTVKSSLDSVPGIGPAKRAQLLKTFGSVKKIKTLSVEELASAPGISPKLAKMILDTLGPGDK